MEFFTQRQVGGAASRGLQMKQLQTTLLHGQALGNVPGNYNGDFRDICLVKSD